jgi:hypothetical protein
MMYLFPSVSQVVFSFLSLLSNSLFFSESQVVPLLDPAFLGMSGTIKHYLYSHYDVLSDYTIFLKDNNRKQPVSILQRLGAAAGTLRHDTGFMNLSDVLPQFHYLIRLGPGHLKSRSMERVLNPRELPGSVVNKTSGLLLHNSLKNSKYQEYLLAQDAWCRAFEDLTCGVCSNALLPVRSQMLLSAARVHSIPRELFNPLHSVHYEYTWGLVFNCFKPYFGSKPKYPVLPWLHCVDKSSSLPARV